MTDETVTKWRCSHCRTVFEEPYEADEHVAETDAETVREIEGKPAPKTRATSLSDWDFQSASDRAKEADR